ncbi:ATP-grasp domain-containing protein [Candidatus Nitrotoga sp. M5]|uniref:ATP-grasp domain-containing protein n=1 Tax=Candidatus Nitrotoga sp. M5 TaxID=2890409 RepID=UPI001EF3C4C9|nr:ATP-grasp domain-containing protein [Candidatus Nitrotoga sp. M5]CAH1386080.1 ATP-grasp domain-containing protein [Candidatus Nitrotoga sp. M5]
MQRVWFNKTFSSVAAAISLIREADVVGDYHIVCSNTNPHAPGFFFAHESSIEPSGLKGKDYLDWCLHFCRANNIDIFVPGKEASLVSAAREQFATQGTRVLCAALQEVLHLLHDKALFYQSVDLKLAPPAAFRVVEDVEQFDAAYRELRDAHKKLCVKPSVSVYGLGFSVVDEERSSAQLLLDGIQYHIGLDDLRRGFATMNGFRTMLVMEYLDGHEYSVDCVGDNGRLICAVPRKKAKMAGQGQMIELRDDILESTRQLTSTYGLNGVFNIQFREGQNGICLLEINPRMSGGLAMACLAGPNLPYLALVGFDRGFDGLRIPPIRAGIRVAELARAMELK